jgi:hypothetical protein
LREGSQTAMFQHRGDVPTLLVAVRQELFDE